MLFKFSEIQRPVVQCRGQPETKVHQCLFAGAISGMVGINLLREGLDIPEITLVAILDADKEGFLRSETSLIQTIGRAARNADGHVIMYENYTLIENVCQ